jgi:prepilin-type N-terminal cleavage/methylation domain-containing protein
MVLKNKNQKGFTLIELIVVMAIFLFVIGTAIGIFISMVQNQKKVLAEQQFLNQISYVEEYMSKALRMAGKDEDGTSCLGTGYAGYSYLLSRPYGGYYEGVKFLDQSNNICEEFYWNDQKQVLEEIKNNDNANPVDLTSSNMKITSVRFGVDGTTGCVDAGSTNCPNGDNADSVASLQPRVTMVFKIIIPGENQGGKNCASDTDCLYNEACDKKCVPARIIQTTVSQRNLNYKTNE